MYKSDEINHHSNQIKQQRAQANMLSDHDLKVKLNELFDLVDAELLKLDNSDLSNIIHSYHLKEIDEQFKIALHNIVALNDIKTGKVKTPGQIYKPDAYDSINA